MRTRTKITIETEGQPTRTVEGYFDITTSVTPGRLEGYDLEVPSNLYLEIDGQVIRTEVIPSEPMNIPHACRSCSYWSRSRSPEAIRCAVVPSGPGCSVDAPNECQHWEASSAAPASSYQYQRQGPGLLPIEFAEITPELIREDDLRSPLRDLTFHTFNEGSHPMNNDSYNPFRRSHLIENDLELEAVARYDLELRQRQEQERKAMERREEQARQEAQAREGQPIITLAMVNEAKQSLPNPNHSRYRPGDQFRVPIRPQLNPHAIPDRYIDFLYIVFSMVETSLGPRWQYNGPIILN